ncbi:hypothetical protein HY029_01725 [Candidatus Gottesmanbacteria bacterium]|nr:hypothetical protein [Candidatus Gottesmanbacteria bacterium]
MTIVKELDVLRSERQTAPYFFMNDITPSQVTQLIEYSNDLNDTAIQSYTSDTGDTGRFRSLDAYNKWRVQGKSVYTLVDAADNLRGIIWIASKAPPDDFQYFEVLDKNVYKLTTGIRLYKEARRSGLAPDFYQRAFQHFFANMGGEISNSPRLWGNANRHNSALLNTIARVGFRQVSYPLNNRVIVAR